MSDPVTAAIEAIQATSADYDATVRDMARELGQRRVQVMLLKEALDRYAVHTRACAESSGLHCRCGLADALRIGEDV